MKIYTVFISYYHGDHYSISYCSLSGVIKSIESHMEYLDLENDYPFERLKDLDFCDDDYSDVYWLFSDGSWITVSKTKLIN